MSRLARLLGLATVLMVARAPAAGAQLPVVAATPVTDSVYVRDVGPGRPGRLLREALARPHVVLRPGGRVEIPRDRVYETTVIVLGPEVALDGRVRGDLIVVGGDAFVHPGATVEGKAVAVGGCVYPARADTLPTTITRGIECYEDETFDVRTDAAGRLALDYRSLVDRSVPLFELPLGVGLRIPTYDRVNGVSVAFGPNINLDTGRIVVTPLVTYRSNLGDLDPAVLVHGEIGRRSSFDVRAQRGTFTNERWIRDSLVNSLMSLIVGRDARNYYRADRIDGTVRRRWEGSLATLEPWAGVATERAWSAGLDTTTRRSGRRPWSVLDRNNVEEGMRRPNPRVQRGRITSALAGSRLEWESRDLSARVDLGTEVALAAPDGQGFVQGILDAETTFPVIRDHTIDMQLHAMFTASDSTPPQRYSYVGGSGTIPTRRLLSMGGDRLLHLDSRYNVPLSRPVLPVLGTPVVTLRHVLGGAGVGRLPALVQNVGARVTMGFARIEYMLDPASGDSNFSFGIAFGAR